MAEVARELGVERTIGLGSPGLLDRERGSVLEAPNLHFLEGVSLRDELAHRLDLPPKAVLLENDANVAALGEHWLGAGRGESDLLTVTLGTGVGGGLVLAGRLFSGAGGMAGEIGHVVVDPEGVRCACGKTGCLETILSAPHLRESFQHGDRPLASVGTVLGGVLAPVVAALNLHEVVLAGPPDLLDGELRQALDRCVRDRVMAASSADLVVRLSPLGDDVVLVGAAVLVLSGELGVS
jgi:predicted NBD/HSP70 family sugar kinase